MNRKSCEFVMYKYTFILNTGQRESVIGDMFEKVLKDYFRARGSDIISDNVLIKDIVITPHPKYKNSVYHVDKELIDKIVKQLKEQNHSTPQVVDNAKPLSTNTPSENTLQQQKCKEMKAKCPEGSNEVAPIMMYEDWCDDVPYQEFVKQDDNLSNCYRLGNLINSFVGGLEAEKSGNPMPQWPTDPFNKNPIPVKRLKELYNQAIEANLEIPKSFSKFIKALDRNVFNVKIAMEGPYIGLTDKINPAYQEAFVEPAVNVLFKEDADISNVQTQEEKDLQMAIQLAEQFGYQ